MERRLTTIMLTDMVDYSRLVGLDEEGTIARQRSHREEIFDPKHLLDVDQSAVLRQTHCHWLGSLSVSRHGHIDVNRRLLNGRYACCNA